MRINTRLFIFLAVFAALLLGVSGLIYQVSYNTLQERVVSDSELIAEQIVEKLHSRIHYIEEDMRLFALSYGLDWIEAEGKHDRLPPFEFLNRRFVRFFETEYGYKLYENVILYDVSGEILRASWEDCISSYEDEWWQQVLADGVSYTMIENEAGIKVVSIAIALRDQVGTPWAVMQATTSINALMRGGGLSLAKMNARRIDLLTPDGEVLYSTSLHSPGQRIDNVEYLEQIQQGEGFVAIELSGVKELVISRLHTHGKQESFKWNLVLHLDYNKTFGQLLELRWWLYSGVFVILLTGGAFYVFVTRTISTPLVNVAKSTEKFGEGDMAERIRGGFSGEFKILVDTFNAMADNIVRNKEQLEAIVEERTQSLKATNETLMEEIEEKTMAQAELAETSAILQTAMDCSPAGIAIADAPNGALRYVNKAGLGIRKGSRDELVENVSIDQYVGSWNILHFDGSPFAPDEVPLARAILYGETNDRQFILQRPDKEDRVVWAHAAPVINDDGEIIAGIVVFPDITEVKKAERTLEESKEQLDAIISKAPLPMCVVDMRGNISHINEALTKTLGYTSDDLSTMNDWWGVAYPDQEKRQEMIQQWSNLVEQAQDHGLEIDPLYRDVVRKDGKVRTVEFRVMPLGDILVITMLDLTDQFKLVEELTEGQARLAEAQRLVHMGSWERNLLEDTLWWSDEVYRIFGLPPNRSEVSHEMFMEAVHPGDRPHVEESIRLALESNVPYNIEHRIILPDGVSKVVHERGHVEFEINGTPKKMKGTVQDITETKALEKQLIQASKMESIGQLASGIAHEINTPAQFLQYNTRFFKESFNDLVSLLVEYEKLREATSSDMRLEKIHSEINERSEAIDYDFLLTEIPEATAQSLEGLDRIRRIVQSIKQFAHSSQSEKRPVDINQIVDTVVTVSTNEWKYHSEVYLDLAKRLPPITCSPDLINQALLNLVVNAAHANMEKVKAETTDKAGIYISTGLDGDDVVVSVQDEGNGIPPNIRDRIFDPFFTTKELGKGTGQGLAMVQRTIVAEHEGSIHFETVEGEGTTFVVRLPLT